MRKLLKTLAKLGLIWVGLWLTGCQPRLQGRIVFSSDRDSPMNFDIYVMNADGSNLVRLTQNKASDIEPCWSSDGERIAFASNRNGDYDIYVMEADGSHVVQLTDGGPYGQLYEDKEPAWSPDDEHIAFVSQRDGDWDIYVMDADGANVVNLTNNWAQEFNPAWSPDGERIAFTSRRDNLSIYVMDADGSNPVPLINHPLDGSPESFSHSSCPTWSPDGKRIAFIAALSDTTPGSTGLYVMDVDGSSVARLGDRRGGYPVWSPDGKYIAFTCDSDDICTIKADGRDTNKLIKDEGRNWNQLDWAP